MLFASAALMFVLTSSPQVEPVGEPPEDVPRAEMSAPPLLDAPPSPEPGGTRKGLEPRDRTAEPPATSVNEEGHAPRATTGERAVRFIGSAYAGGLGGSIGSLVGGLGGALIGGAISGCGSALGCFVGAVVGGSVGYVLGVGAGVSLVASFAKSETPMNVAYGAAAAWLAGVIVVSGGVMAASVLSQDRSGIGFMAGYFGGLIGLGLTPWFTAWFHEWGYAWWREGSKPSAVTVAPLLTPGGGGLGFAGRF